MAVALIEGASRRLTPQGWMAVKSGGAAELLRSISMKDAPAVTQHDELGCTVLHWLALRGVDSEMQLALALGADAGAAADNLQTPLMWATIKGNVSSMRVLLRAGASPDARDSLGATAAMLAAQSLQPLALLLLADSGASLGLRDVRGCSVAHWAAYRGDVAALQILRRRGVDLEAVDDEGHTPLHRAARGGQAQAAAFLVETAGVDLFAVIRRPPTLPLNSSADGATAGASPATARVKNLAASDAAAAVGSDAPFASSTIRNRGAVAAGAAAAAGSSSSTAIPSSSSSPSSPGGINSAGGSGTGIGLRGGTAAPGVQSLLAAEDGDKGAAKLSIAARTQLAARAAIAAAAASRQAAAAASASSASAGGPSSSSSSPPSSSSAPPEDAVFCAEDTLRVVLSSARSGGSFSGSQDLLLGMRACVKYLRAQRAARLQATAAPLRALLARVVLSPSGRRWIVAPLAAALSSLLPLLLLSQDTAELLLPHPSPNYSPQPLWAWYGPLSLYALAALSLVYLTCADAGALDPWGTMGKAPVVPARLCGGARAAAAGGVGPSAASAAATGRKAANAEGDNGAEETPLLLLADPRPAPTAEAAPRQRGDDPPAAAVALPIGAQTPADRLWNSIEEEVGSIRAALGQELASHSMIADRPEAATTSFLNPRVAVQARLCFSCELLQPLRAVHDPLLDRCFPIYEEEIRFAGAPITAANRHAAALLALLLNAAVVSCLVVTLILPGASHRILSALIDAAVLLLIAWPLLLRATFWLSGLTSWEWAHRHELPHLFRLVLAPTGELLPRFFNPFERGGLWANLGSVGALGCCASRSSSAAPGGSAVTTAASLASRVVSDIDEAADGLQKLISISASVSTAPAALNPAPVAPVAAAAGGATAGGGTGAGDAMGDASLPPRPHPAAPALPLAIRQRVIAMRAAVSSSPAAWSQFLLAAERRLAPPRSHHGHSHGPGGHGHGGSRGIRAAPTPGGGDGGGGGRESAADQCDGTHGDHGHTHA